MYKITTIPGFQQQDYSDIEYHVDHYYCERITRDPRVKNPVDLVGICEDGEAVNSIYQRLEQLDWSEISDFASRNNGVDSVEMFSFRGEFGGILIPLNFCVRNEKLPLSEKELCGNLLKLFGDIERLTYG